MAKKKLYHTIIQVEILSEEPYVAEDLNTIAYDITDGECSGVVKTISQKTLTGKKAVEEVYKQESGVDFFRMDDDGNEVED